MALKTLFARRHQKAKWLFAIAALPLMLFALIGANYGAFIPYAILSLICLAQVFYPTLFVWGFVFLLFLVALVAYGYALIVDALRIVQGQQAQIFLNPYDTSAFIALVLVLVVVVLGLARIRPTPAEHVHN